MSEIRQQALACRDAAQVMFGVDGDGRRALLRDMAKALLAATPQILAANERDVQQAAHKGVQGALLDRLKLDESRVEAMAKGVAYIAELPDPVGQITRSETRPNGLQVDRVRIPLGVIVMIYEARPNVTADAAALCLMAGNTVILRGGSEAVHSNTAIANVLCATLEQHELPPAAITLVEDLRRETMLELLQLSDIVDLAIPRGGEGLIRFVAENARVPVIKHYKGVCHLYVDASADLTLARDLLIDGKTSRPGVCNALETLLVHRDVAEQFLPAAMAALQARGVEVRGCERTRALAEGVQRATDDDYAAEFLDLILAVRVVDDLGAAIGHVQRFGSDHTEVIATTDETSAQRFIGAIRAAVVMINASSRFSDGGELGLGAEIGISTTRLHAYGPMGAESLTVERFVIRGQGQVRHPQSRQAPA